MRSIFLISTLLLSTSAFAQFTGDPCALAGTSGSTVMSFMNPSLNDTISDANLLLGLALTKERRLKVLCELKSAVTEKYSLLQLKQERLGLDVEQHMQQCAREELAITS